ncbi:MAG TPA: restriction endonuclease subunit S [Alcanivorax sp.]|nr:restriction endonuclease subunit S [Alcanivorax sp.]
MVPNGWDRKSLAELCDKPVSYGIVQTGPRVEKGVPCLRVVDLTRREMSLGNMITTSPEIHQAYKRTTLEVGDIVMALRGEIGLAKLVDNEVAGANITRGLARISANPERALPEFLLWEIRSPDFRADLIRRVGGSALQEISLSELRKTKTLVPPIEEQKKIAKILSTWDEAIATTEQLLANSEQQKKALMQQLLTGKKRLPGFEGEWRQLSLTDIGDISSAGVDKKSDKNEMKVRLLNYLDVFRKEFIFNQELQHEVTAPDAKIASCDVRKGDVFFTPSSETRDELAFPAVACETMPGVVYSYHVVRLRPKIKLDLNFSAYLFQTREFKRQAYRAGDGSGQRYVISQKAFRRMEVSVPSISEQEAIGRVLRAASDEIIELSQELDFLIEEKKALMQQLLTGKRRVKVDEAERATA